MIPVLPMKDTVYVSSDGKHVSSLLNRGEIFAGQAPELFVLGKYYEANERLLPHRIFQINGSTEAAVLGGMDIVMIPGDEGIIKLRPGQTWNVSGNLFRKKRIRWEKFQNEGMGA